MDDELKKIFEEMKALAANDLQKYKLAKMMLNGSQDAAVLNMTIGNFECPMLLIHVEVIAMFNDFLDQAIAYYEQESKGV